MPTPLSRPSARFTLFIALAMLLSAPLVGCTMMRDRDRDRSDEDEDDADSDTDAPTPAEEEEEEDDSVEPFEGTWSGALGELTVSGGVVNVESIQMSASNADCYAPNASSCNSTVTFSSGTASISAGGSFTVAWSNGSRLRGTFVSDDRIEGSWEYETDGNCVCSSDGSWSATWQGGSGGGEHDPDQVTYVFQVWPTTDGQLAGILEVRYVEDASEFLCAEQFDFVAGVDRGDWDCPNCWGAIVDIEYSDRTSNCDFADPSVRRTASWLNSSSNPWRELQLSPQIPWSFHDNVSNYADSFEDMGLDVVFAIYGTVNVGNGPELMPWGLLGARGDWQGGLDMGSPRPPGAGIGDDYFFGATWWLSGL